MSVRRLSARPAHGPVARARTHPLSPEADQLVQIAAVFGASFSLDDAAEVVGQPVGRLLPALDEAIDAGILAPRGGVLAFRHKPVRQAVYERIAEPVRVALHRQIGALLLERGGSADPSPPTWSKGSGQATATRSRASTRQPAR